MWCWAADRPWPRAASGTAPSPAETLHGEETALIWDCITPFQPTLIIPAQKAPKTKQKLFTEAKKSKETQRWFQCDKRKLKCNFSPRSFSSKGWPLYLRKQKRAKDNLFPCPNRSVSQHKIQASASMWNVKGRRDALYLDPMLPSAHSRDDSTFHSQNLLLQHCCRQNTDYTSGRGSVSEPASDLLASLPNLPLPPWCLTCCHMSPL